MSDPAGPSNDAYLRLLLESTEEGFYAVDREGRTTLSNRGFQRMLGFNDGDEVMGRQLHDIVHHSHPDGSHYPAADCPIYRCAREGIPAHVSDELFFRVDGTPLPVEYRVHPIYRDGELLGAVCTFLDMTARENAAADLRASEARFRAAVDAVHGVLWTNDADGRMVGEQPGWAALTGQTRAEYEGYGWAAAVHPEDAQPTVEAWNEAVRERRTFVFEHRVRRHDGAWRICAIRAMPTYGPDRAIREWVGVHTDITEQRQAEQRLRELNETLERQVDARTRERDRLWELSEDLLVVADYEGRLLRVSPSWTRVLGHSEAALLDRDYEWLIHPDDRALVAESLDRMRSTGRSVSFDDRIVAHDGAWRWFSWTLSPEPRGDRLTGVGRDVTADRQHAAELAAAQDALRQSQKMEAVGQLTGGIAHDFNNLLTGIIGSLELLQARAAQGRVHDVARYVAAAQGAAKRAAALTHRLLAFSRRQTLDPKPVNMNSLVADMGELVQRTVGPAVTVEVVGAAGLWTTLADPNQLENALLNLCINARDAMPDGGRLTIETANRWMDERSAQERELEPGQYVSLCVSDTGTGMSPEVVARAFDPFFTTKPIGQGTGLGLSMIYGFTRQSGGQARIYSEPGRGTLVCLYLPRHRGPAEQEPEAVPRPLERAEQGETVLVVDDEPTIRMLVAEVLQDLGYAAIEAPDGPAGLLALQSDRRVDLLVTDVGLPGGMNGRQLADAARLLRPGLKVLFITGYAENAVIGHGHLEPGMHVLTKPFAMEALATRIRALISGR